LARIAANHTPHIEFITLVIGWTWLWELSIAVMRRIVGFGLDVQKIFLKCFLYILLKTLENQARLAKTSLKHDMQALKFNIT